MTPSTAVEKDMKIPLHPDGQVHDDKAKHLCKTDHSAAISGRSPNGLMGLNPLEMNGAS